MKMRGKCYEVDNNVGRACWHRFFNKVRKALSMYNVFDWIVDGDDNGS